MSPRLIIRRYTKIRDADTPSSRKPSSSLSGGPLAAVILLPIILGISLLVVFTVLWHRRAQRRRVAEHDSAHPQQPVSIDAVAQLTAAQPSSPPPPPPPSKSPRPPEPPARRPSLRERIRISLPGLTARLSGGSGGTRGSGCSRADPVLPRIQAPPLPQLLFNSDDMLAPRRARPRSAQQRATLGPPLSPPPTQPLPPTPTSAAAGGILLKERDGEGSESERSNGRGKPKVRPLPPVPDPKAPPPSIPIVLQPNRLGEPGLPLSSQHDHHHPRQPQQQEGHQQEAMLLLVPRGRWADRGPDGDSDMMPPPYTSPAYGTRSRP